jgi:hypothetical protein
MGIKIRRGISLMMTESASSLEEDIIEELRLRLDRLEEAGLEAGPQETACLAASIFAVSMGFPLLACLELNAIDDTRLTATCGTAAVRSLSKEALRDMFDRIDTDRIRSRRRGLESGRASLRSH